MPIEVNTKFLDSMFRELEKKNRVRDINRAYMKGKNPSILKKAEDKPPDNRIPIPLAKMAVEDMSGYAGRPGDIKLNFERVVEEGEEENRQEDDYVKLISEVREFNDDDLEVSELYQDALSFGEAYELWWTSEELELGPGMLTPEYKILDVNECLPIWKPTLKREMEAFIRFYKLGDNMIADIYEPKIWNRWIKEKDKDVWVSAESSEHLYNRVPVNHYTINRDMEPLFEAEKSLIDAGDVLVSKSQNEVDRYNALVTLFPGPVNKEFMDKLNKLLAMDDLAEFPADQWPHYLEKNLQGVKEFYAGLADRLERLFHKSVKIPDMTSESFAGGQQSGRAIAFKLVGMEFKAAMIEIYFNQGLKRRIDFFNDVIKMSELPFKNDLDDYMISIKSQRNLPVDEATKVEVAVQLKGLGLSMETILKVLPNTLVDDFQKELKRIEEEGPEPDPFEGVEEPGDDE